MKNFCLTAIIYAYENVCVAYYCYVKSNPRIFFKIIIEINYNLYWAKQVFTTVFVWQTITHKKCKENLWLSINKYDKLKSQMKSNKISNKWLLSSPFQVPRSSIKIGHTLCIQYICLRVDVLNCKTLRFASCVEQIRDFQHAQNKIKQKSQTRRNAQLN